MLRRSPVRIRGKRRMGVCLTGNVKRAKQENETKQEHEIVRPSFMLAQSNGGIVRPSFMLAQSNGVNDEDDNDNESVNPSLDQTNSSAGDSADNEAKHAMQAPSDPQLMPKEVFTCFDVVNRYVTKWGAKYGIRIGRTDTSTLNQEKCAAHLEKFPNALVDPETNNQLSGKFYCKGTQKKCTFFIRYVMIPETGQIKITSVRWDHSHHQLMIPDSKTKREQLTEHEISYISSHESIPMALFRPLMLKEFGRIDYAPDLMYRLRTDARVNLKGEEGSVQKLFATLRALTANGGVFETEVDEHLRITNLYLQLPEWRQFIQYNDYVVVDGTFRMSAYDEMVMLAAVVVDAMGKTVLAGVALIQSENAKATARALQLFGLDCKGATLHSDGALGFAAAAKFLQMIHMLCAWHYLVNLPSSIAQVELTALVVDSVDSNAISERAELRDRDVRDEVRDVRDEVRDELMESVEDTDMNATDANHDMSNSNSDEHSNSATVEQDTSGRIVHDQPVSSTTSTTRGANEKRARKKDDVPILCPFISEIHKLVLFPLKSEEEFDAKLEDLSIIYQKSDTAIKIIDALKNDKARVAATFTQRYFSCGHSSSVRGEGFFGVFKKGITPSAMANWLYPQIVKHLTITFNAHAIRVRSDLKKCLEKDPNRDWGDYVHTKWVKARDRAFQYRAETVPNKEFEYCVTYMSNQSPSTYVVSLGRDTHATCNCLEFSSSLIPCAHICCAVEEAKRNPNDPDLLAPRWRLSNHPFFASVQQELNMSTSMFQQMPAQTEDDGADASLEFDQSESFLPPHVQISHNELERDEVFNSLVNQLRTQSKRSIAAFQHSTARLAELIGETATIHLRNQVSSAAQAANSAVVNGDDVSNNNHLRMGLEPLTKRQVTSAKGRASTVDAASSLALATIKSSSRKRGGAGKSSPAEPSQRRCTVCLKPGHQKNNKECKGKPDDA